MRHWLTKEKLEKSYNLLQNNKLSPNGLLDDELVISNKLVEYAIKQKKNYFDYIIVDMGSINIDDIDWLPKLIRDAIMKSENDADRTLEFDIWNYEIIYYYTSIDPETGDYSENVELFEVKVTKSEFVIYLAMLFYYFPEVNIMNIVDYEDDDYNDIFLQHKYMNNPKYMQEHLPEWSI